MTARGEGQITTNATMPANCCACTNRNIARNRCTRASCISDDETASHDTGKSGIGADAVENLPSAALLDNAARTADRSGKGPAGRIAEAQRAGTKCYARSSNTAQCADGLAACCTDVEISACRAEIYKATSRERPTGTERQRACIDCRAAGISVCAGECLPAPPRFRDSAHAADRSAECGVCGTT